ncbi:hypothetical protein AMTR_s00080p00090810 [Amborella trichopoda]|uniref:Uncharacterized protein n=1 Tax=Amborella trichopoda TaxID=13333 RepID=W1PB39_AMBTC|nr:hypothetical protein AMTR_s00080p00090810 [Amborella trichopoda]
MMDKVAKLLTTAEWESVNRRSDGQGTEEDPTTFKYWNSCKTYLFGGLSWFKLAKKYGLKIGDTLNVEGHRDSITNELLFEFTINRKI